jgi:hypothetical protein
MFAADAKPRWLTLYEADSAAVFQSPAYLERLANPTPGTRAVLTSFLATERMIGEVVAGAGRGVGGALACLRLWNGEKIDDGRLEELVRTVSDHAPALSCLALRNIGLIQRTEEQKLRGGDLDAPDLVLLAELYARGPNGWQAPAAFSGIADQFARARTDIYLPEWELAG